MADIFVSAYVREYYEYFFSWSKSHEIALTRKKSGYEHSIALVTEKSSHILYAIPR